MSARYRVLFLTVCYLAVVAFLCSTEQAAAQPRTPPRAVGQAEQGPGRHEIWNNQVSPDQIRERLLKYGVNPSQDDLLQELVRQALRMRNPNTNKDQIDATAKRLLENKEFRDRLTDIVQKHANQQPIQNGQQPTLTPEEIERLSKLKQNWTQPDQVIPPDGPHVKVTPDQDPLLNPKLPKVDPGKLPKIDPKNPPKIDPVPPKVDPKQPQPPVDFPKDANPKPPGEIKQFDPQHPLGKPDASPDKSAKQKAMDTATAFWEKNIGPIEESPGVKRALTELLSDQDFLESMRDDQGNSLFDWLNKDTGDGEKMGDWFGGNSTWEWPKFNWGWGRDGDQDHFDSRPDRRDRGSTDRWSRDSSSSRGLSPLDGMGSFHIGSLKVPVYLFLILLAIVLALVVWWKWGSIIALRPASKAAATAGGGWPIDPRTINTREDVIKAFEYLSVMLCGAGAKTWTHSTIADELSVLAASNPQAAFKLARLYELARYAPLDEPLARVELIEARRLVCELAGMDEA